MANRKFFLGDLVQVAATSKYLSRHSYADSQGLEDGHCGLITKTTIGSRNNQPSKTVLYYTVQCECGKELRPQTKDLELVATPSDNHYAPVTSMHRLFYFLYRAGVPEQQDVHKQVHMLLDTLSERGRWLMTMRFGIPGVLSPLSDGSLPYTAPPSMTLWEIGQELGISKQRVEQIEKATLKRVRKEWDNISKESE